MSRPPLRVRIHLNLAKPELAENAVRVQAPTGAWVTVGYATELVMENCHPVVDPQAQEKISQGQTRKIPHAFIEGDLVHFKGRERTKAPETMAQQARPYLQESKAGLMAGSESVPVNYNPRFAKCFYQDHADKTQIQDRFVDCQRLVAVGWSFRAEGARFSPMLETDWCQDHAISRTSLSEKVGIRRGKETTQRLLGGIRGF